MGMGRTRRCASITTEVRKKDSSDTEMCVVFFTSLKYLAANVICLFIKDRCILMYCFKTKV